MRIGVYFGDFAPDLGGAYTHVESLLDGLISEVERSRHDFVVICSHKAVDAFKSRMRSPKAIVVGVPPLRRATAALIGVLYFSPLLRWLFRRRRTALERVAAAHGVQLIWFVGVTAHMPCDMPYVANVWDVQHRLQPYFPEVSAEGVWDKRDQFYSHFLRRATYCLTGADANKRAVSTFYQIPEDRIRVLPLPTPTFALDAPPSQIDVCGRFGIPGDYVFYPAQFWPHKNHVTVVLALKWLRQERGVDLNVVFCGSDRGNLGYVRSLAAEHGVSDHVRFLGFLSTEEIVALYRSAVALPFVSYFGPDNLPPLEALALGCPVIAADMPGVKEQYGDSVLLVDGSSVSAVGQAIERIYSDDMLKDELRAAGFRRARSWTSSDCMKSMLDLFDEFAAIRRTWA